MWVVKRAIRVLVFSHTNEVIASFNRSDNYSTVRLGNNSQLPSCFASLIVVEVGVTGEASAT